MMMLQQKWPIFRVAREERRRIARDLQENVHADGKVRAIYECAIFLSDDISDFVEPWIPAGRPDYDGHLQGNEPANVLYCRLRRREFDRHVDTGQTITDQAS